MNGIHYIIGPDNVALQHALRPVSVDGEVPLRIGPLYPKIEQPQRATELS